MINMINYLPILANWLYWNPITALACLVAGIAIAAVIMLAKRAKLKSVHRAQTANNYVRPSSFKLALSRDNILFNNISRISPAKNNNTGGARKRR